MINLNIINSGLDVPSTSQNTYLKALLIFQRVRSISRVERPDTSRLTLWRRRQHRE
jgi:hypothetical protein